MIDLNHVHLSFAGLNQLHHRKRYPYRYLSYNGIHLFIAINITNALSPIMFLLYLMYNMYGKTRQPTFQGCLHQQTTVLLLNCQRIYC